MYKYKNKKTGEVVETSNKVTGKNWLPMKEADTKKADTKKADTKKADAKKADAKKADAKKADSKKATEGNE